MYRSRASVQLSSSMVWHDDALDTMFHSQLCVLLGQDAFNDNGQPSDGLQPVHVFPANGRVQGVGWDPVALWACCLLHVRIATLLNNTTTTYFEGLVVFTWKTPSRFLTLRWGGSLNWLRMSLRLFPVYGTSTVRTRALYPSSSTRCTICSDSFRSR